MIDLKLNHHELTEIIRASARSAIESRQVSSRLRKLLPLRIKEVLAHISRNHKGAGAERLGLTHPDYIQHVQELVDLTAHTRYARVQYETHLMLLEARRTLRALRARDTRY